MQDIFLIGGSPSSGSTLLVHLLNSNNGFLCLPETGLFVHGKNLVGAHMDGFDSNIHMHLPWVNTSYKVSQAIGLDPDTYDEAINEYSTAFDLLWAYLDTDMAVYLIEKTPENIFAFYPYLAESLDNRVVVTIRDAMSVTQSLIRRCFTMIEALLIWFGHSYEAARLIRDFPEQVYLCAYEQLTKYPAKTVEKVFDFWGIDPEQTRGESTHRYVPTSSGQLMRAYENAEMINYLVNCSSRNLASTAWTKSPDSKIDYIEPVNLLGLDYQSLLECLMFRTKDDGLLKTSDIEGFLSGEVGSLTSVRDSRAVPLQIETNSELTHCLFESYPPYLSKAY